MITIKEMYDAANRFAQTPFARKQMDEGVEGFVSIPIKIGNDIHRADVVYYTSLDEVEISFYGYCDPDNDRDWMWPYHSMLTPSDTGCVEDLNYLETSNRDTINELYHLLYDKMIEEVRK